MVSGFLKADLLDGIPHGFSTSAGLEADDIARGAKLMCPRQIHSATVVIVDEPWPEPPQADALVTARRGIALGIVTADCAPVLLSDAKAGVVGAAHAGWRGAVGGVLEHTVAAMVSLGAHAPDIKAAIGPTIAQGSYEVDQGFREQFDNRDARFFATGRPGHYQFDLPAYVYQCLSDTGVRDIEDLREDTYAQPHRFFSFRRATHRGEETGGRQLSVIALPV